MRSGALSHCERQQEQGVAWRRQEGGKPSISSFWIYNVKSGRKLARGRGGAVGTRLGVVAPSPLTRAKTTSLQERRGRGMGSTAQIVFINRSQSSIPFGGLKK